MLCRDAQGSAAEARYRRAICGNWGRPLEALSRSGLAAGQEVATATQRSRRAGRFAAACAALRLPPPGQEGEPDSLVWRSARRCGRSVCNGTPFKVRPSGSDTCLRTWRDLQTAYFVGRLFESTAAKGAGQGEADVRLNAYQAKCSKARSERIRPAKRSAGAHQVVARIAIQNRKELLKGGSGRARVTVLRDSQPPQLVVPLDAVDSGLRRTM